ncbi:MAG: hypothetical protein IJG60_05120 [Thermoguttaceae bacterium]|nr:hypothetical protein [Thermoguttaceae bacterium]
MNFYIIRPLRTKNFWDYNDVITDGRLYDKTCPPFCPYCGRQLRPYVVLPLNVDLGVAKPYFCDIVYDFEFIYVTERFRNLFDKSGLKGIENFREVTLNKIKTHNGVRKANLPEPPRYFLADVVVDGAAIDLKKSRAVFHRPEFCHYCMFPTQEPYKEDLSGNLGLVKWNGYFIDQTRWKDNNVFIVLGKSGIYAVDEKFKDWFEENQLLPGCSFIPEQDYREDYIHDGMATFPIR